MKHLKLQTFLILLSILCLPLISFTTGESTPSQIRGTWSGQWKSPSGSIYTGIMTLVPTGDRTVEGRINWTMNRSPGAEEQSRLEMTGIEFVRGSYDPENRVLSLEGYARNDPKIILGLDKYRLILPENSAAIGGVTWNHGSWKGLFGLLRME
ncbi:MAG TPA: hypothetical protein VN371_05840 [Chlorobaculum sp.]|nr:hypothetical protein [Chlorobaculum sp.]